MTWENTTSYSQREKDRTPRTWSLRLGDFRLSITRHIHHAPDVWLANCCGILEQEILQNKEVKAAKAEAISLLAKRLNEVLEKIGQLPREE